MDATKRPLTIPPEISNYAEKHGLFDLLKRLMSELVIARPDDPLDFMIDFLKRDDNDVPRIVLMGPPAAGKRSISQLLCKNLGAVHVTMENVLSQADPKVAAEAQSYLDQNQPIPIDLWAQLVHSRLLVYDAVKKGWVIDNLIETREQYLALSMLGSFPKHAVLLYAPDGVLIERAAGKRIDPETGDIYHVTFDMPLTSSVANRLLADDNNSIDQMVERLVAYHRNAAGLETCFKNILKTVNADQPKADVLMQVMTFVSQPARSAAPHTPRVLLVGSRGSGKTMQAAMLSAKYRIVDVSCGRLIKQAIASHSNTGLACKTYMDQGMLVPDAIVLQLLKSRLSQLDCVTRGWVLHGYPQSRDQADNLADAGFTPNRVFFLDISYEAVLERLTLRATDPVTGNHYHLLYNPPRTQEIRDRLETNPVDREETVVAALTQYQAYREDLSEFYTDQGVVSVQRINADQDKHTVFETIESMIVNPLPKQSGDVNNHV